MKKSTLIISLLLVFSVMQSMLFAQIITPPKYNLTWLADGTSMDYSNPELTINVRVANKPGVAFTTQPLDCCRVGYYLSEDVFVDHDQDILVGIDSVYNLAINEYSDESITVDVSAYPGTWYVGFIIDYYNWVPESNENDNSLCWLNPITVNVPVGKGAPSPGGFCMDSRTSVLSPEKFSLAQNSPNPFNPTTTINYAIPKESYVKIKVYNTLGQVVDVLVDEYKSPGYHSVQWDASRLTSGMYLYSIEAGRFKAINRMFLLK